MSRYAYVGVDRSGRPVRGVEAAFSVDTLRHDLEARGIALLETDESTTRQGTSRHAADQLRAMATLVAAGVPISRALAEAERTSPPSLRTAIASARTAVDRGDSLSVALAREGAIANQFQLALIRAGEASGDIGGALDRVATTAEQERALRAEIATGLIYPALLTLVGGASLLVMLLFVVPRFRTLFDGAAVSLPWTTEALLWTSGLLTENAAGLLLLAVCVLMAPPLLGSTDAGREAIARFTLRLPLIGRARRTQLRARFARLAATLVAGGAPIGSVLPDIADAMGDPVAEAQARRIAQQVRAGKSLSGSLASSPLLSGSLARLVAIGEQTGRLGPMLEAAAESHETAMRRQLARLTKLVEPALTVLFGLVVGSIAVALLQAVYGVNAAALR